MSHLREIVTCAFLSYDTVQTMGRRCLLGVLLLPIRLPVLLWVKWTFESEFRNFGPENRALLRRMPLQVVFKVCPRTIQSFLLPISDICGNFCFLGSRGFKITYKKALTLEQKITSRLNTLIENLSSWTAAITNGPSEDTIPDIITLQQLGEVKLAWENARDSVRMALAILTSEPAQRVALMRPRSTFKRWMKSLVCFP